jgi:hypothetical protein
MSKMAKMSKKAHFDHICDENLNQPTKRNLLDLYIERYSFSRAIF